MDSTERSDLGSLSKIDVVLALLDSQAERSLGAPRPTTIGTLSVFQKLEDALAQRGGSLHRSFDALSDSQTVTVLWDIASFRSLPRDVRAKAGDRIIGFCLESPLIAHRAYHRLPSIAKKTSHLFLFPGALNLVPPRSTERHPIFWPNEHSRNFFGRTKKSRSFLVMVASNKRAYRGWEGIQLKRPHEAARMIASRFVAVSYGWRGEWNVPDLYSLRLEAVRHFSANPNFNLYGMGWDKPVASERRYRESIASCYRGPVESKDVVMRDHQFALCFENTIFPGYITEKVFDCFFAGTIPVYLGAPDVEQYIPAGSFIDARKFASFSELEDYLLSLDEVAIEDYRQRMREFLESDRFTPFISSSLVKSFLDAIEAVNAPSHRRDSCH